MLALGWWECVAWESGKRRRRRGRVKRRWAQGSHYMLSKNTPSQRTAGKWCTSLFLKWLMWKRNIGYWWSAIWPLMFKAFLINFPRRHKHVCCIHACKHTHNVAVLATSLVKPPGVKLNSHKWLCRSAALPVTKGSERMWEVSKRQFTGDLVKSGDRNRPLRHTVFYWYHCLRKKANPELEQDHQIGSWTFNKAIRDFRESTEPRCSRVQKPWVRVQSRVQVKSKWWP